MTKTMTEAIYECRKYVTRGARIPDNGRLGIHPTFYRDLNEWYIPVRIYFYNDPDKRDDETEFDIDPKVFAEAVKEDSEDMFWEKFTEELSEIWDGFTKENNLEPACVREVAILY